MSETMGKSDADGTGKVIDVTGLSGSDQEFYRWESQRTWMSVI